MFSYIFLLDVSDSTFWVDSRLGLQHLPSPWSHFPRQHLVRPMSPWPSPRRLEYAEYAGVHWQINGKSIQWVPRPNSSHDCHDARLVGAPWIQVAGRKRTFALKDLAHEIDGVKARPVTSFWMAMAQILGSCPESLSMQNAWRSIRRRARVPWLWFVVTVWLFWLAISPPTRSPSNFYRS
jgi:hypothetical protein